MAPTGAEQRDGHDGATEDKEPACDVVTDDDTDDDVEDENEEDVEEVSLLVQYLSVRNLGHLSDNSTSYSDESEEEESGSPAGVPAGAEREKSEKSESPEQAAKEQERRKKKSSKRSEKQKKRGEKLEKRRERREAKRAKRLEKNKSSQFNLRNTANKLIYFVEEVDDDTFEFPAIPNQVKQSGSNKLAIKFLSKLSKVFHMKVVTLHKVKKFAIIGAMRTPKTPCFVSEKDRENVKDILKEWNKIKNPEESDKKEEGKKGDGKGTSSSGSSSSTKETKKPRGVQFVRSESLKDVSEELEGESEKETDEVILWKEESDEVVDKAPPKFEQHTKGFGSKMLSKMGYVPGIGLGKHGQGRHEPLQVVRRGKNVGLGAEQ